MRIQSKRSVSFLFVLALLSGCAGSGYYPISGEPAHTGDPVKQMNFMADYMPSKGF